MTNKIMALTCVAALSTGLLRPATSDAGTLALANVNRTVAKDNLSDSSRHPNIIFLPPARGWYVSLKWRIGAGTLRFFRTCVGDKENNTSGVSGEGTGVINFDEVNSRIKDQIRGGRDCY